MRKRSKQAFSALTFQKLVCIKVIGIDRYERTVGRIYVDDQEVSAEMVRLGAV